MQWTWTYVSNEELLYMQLYLEHEVKPCFFFSNGDLCVSLAKVGRKKQIQIQYRVCTRKNSNEFLVNITIQNILKDQIHWIHWTQIVSI